MTAIDTPDPVFCTGRIVRLRAIQPGDIPAIARLRNASRQCFLNDHEVTESGVAAWLRNMDFPREGMLRIESPDGAFLGVTGWDHLDMARQEAEIGRLMIDPHAILAALPRARRQSVAVDAVRALGRYFFAELGFMRVYTSYIADNRLAARVNECCGMLPTHTTRHPRSEGCSIDVVHLELTYPRWAALQATWAAESESSPPNPIEENTD